MARVLLVANWVKLLPHSTVHLIPRFGWLVAVGRNFNISEETVLSVTWVCLLSAGCFLLLGLLCRPAAILAWFVHLCAAESGGLLAYGADNFMTTALFYLMLSPLPDRYSFDHWVAKTNPKNAQGLGFWRRVLQVHLCFVYFIGGLAKSLGNGWWDGSNLWRSLIRSPFNLVSPDILIRFKYALPVLGISICLARGELSNLHLDQQNSPYLACVHFGDARRHRNFDGIISFRTHDDHHECRSLWRVF